MMVKYGPPDLSKIEKLLERIAGRKSHEERVLERYKRLAGFIKDGEMVNKDKEARARAWVKEQEGIEEEKKKAEKWYQKPWGQIIIGIIIAVVGGLILSWILQK